MYRLTLEIPMLPDSLNISLRSGQFKRTRITKEWTNYLWAETNGKRPTKPLECAAIKLVRHSYRALDFDGVVGSLKPVVDALVGCKILQDDSWRCLGAWTVDQRFRPKKEGPLLSIDILEVLCLELKRQA
jgi:hypothetical protein